MRDSDLDDLLAAAGARDPLPSPALLARVEADGLRLLPAGAATAVRRSRHRGPRALIADMLLAIGGLGGAAGLASAALVGVWIGLAEPQGLTALTDGFAARLDTGPALDSVELLPALDPFASES